MSWKVALFIALPLLFMIGNIMMVKHSAKMKMPSLKDHMPDTEKQPHSESSGDQTKNNKIQSGQD